MKKLIIACLSISILVSLISACGSKEEPTVNSAPFEAAIKEYCKNKSMDMKVSSFENITEKDNDATAICKMEAAEMPGPKVTWQFTFKKEKDKWMAVSRETKR
jgi:nitrous oxide reductase accessory protein NosL